MPPVESEELYNAAPNKGVGRGGARLWDMSKYHLGRVLVNAACLCLCCSWLGEMYQSSHQASLSHGRWKMKGQIDMRGSGRGLFGLDMINKRSVELDSALEMIPKSLYGRRDWKEHYIYEGVFSLDKCHIEEAAPELVAGGDPRNNKNYSDLIQGQLHWFAIRGRVQQRLQDLKNMLEAVNCIMWVVPGSRVAAEVSLLILIAVSSQAVVTTQHPVVLAVM